MSIAMLEDFLGLDKFTGVESRQHTKRVWASEASGHWSDSGCTSDLSGTWVGVTVTTKATLHLI